MFSFALQQTSANGLDNVIVFVEKDFTNARKLQAQTSSAAVPDDRLRPIYDDDTETTSGSSTWLTEVQPS